MNVYSTNSPSMPGASELVARDASGTPVHSYQARRDACYIDGVYAVKSVDGVFADQYGNIKSQHSGGVPNSLDKVVIPDEDATVQSFSVPNYGTWMVVPKDNSSVQKYSGGSSIDTPLSYAVRLE